MTLDNFFQIVGLMTSSYFCVYIILNTIEYFKSKKFLKNKKDYEIDFLNEKNKLLETKIKEQQEELKNISEIIYKQ